MKKTILTLSIMLAVAAMVACKKYLPTVEKPFRGATEIDNKTDDSTISDAYILSHNDWICVASLSRDNEFIRIMKFTTRLDKPHGTVIYAAVRINPVPLNFFRAHSDIGYKLTGRQLLDLKKESEADAQYTNRK